MLRENGINCIEIWKVALRIMNLTREILFNRNAGSYENIRKTVKKIPSGAFNQFLINPTLHSQQHLTVKRPLLPIRPLTLPTRPGHYTSCPTQMGKFILGIGGPTLPLSFLSHQEGPNKRRVLEAPINFERVAVESPAAKRGKKKDKNSADKLHCPGVDRLENKNFNDRSENRPLYAGKKCFGDKLENKYYSENSPNVSEIIFSDKLETKSSNGRLENDSAEGNSEKMLVKEGLSPSVAKSPKERSRGRYSPFCKDSEDDDRKCVGGLPSSMWKEIIIQSADPDGLLSNKQRANLFEWASTGETLERERMLNGKLPSLQIWRVLDATECLSYQDLV